MFDVQPRIATDDRYHDIEAKAQNASYNLSETDLNEETSLTLLTIKQENATSLSDIIKGRRVVDLGYVLTQFEHIVKYTQYCTMGKMNFVKEGTAGLHSSLYFHCDNCDKTVVLSKSNNHPWKQKGVNKRVVRDCLSTGIGHRQCEELLTLLDVPFMNQGLLPKKQLKRGTNICVKQYKQGKKKQHAIDKRNLTVVDGKEMPYIMVIVDGGWSKQSYGHGYNASSGV
ncbi:hypothetical protein ILUMI_26428, partial [Ignelater luminosus]